MDEVDKLKRESKITPQEYFTLRADIYKMQEAVFDTTEFDPEAINEESILEIIRKRDEQLFSDITQERDEAIRQRDEAITQKNAIIKKAKI